MGLWPDGRNLPGVNLLVPHGFDLDGRVMTESDVERIRDWGIKIIRAGFWGLDSIASGRVGEEGLARLDASLDWCERQDLRCLLCLWDTDAQLWGTARRRGRIWGDPALREEVCEVWARIAERCRHRPETLAYELINEPRAPEDGLWNSLARDLTASIRKEDEDHTIVVESNRWGGTEAFAGLEPTGDRNSIYAFHFYEPLVFTNQRAPWMVTFSQYYHETVPYPGEAPRLQDYIQRLPPWTHEVTRRDLERSRGFWDRARLEATMNPALRFREEQGVEIFCSEFGANKRAPRASSLRWLSDVVSLFRRHGISWTYWYYRDMDFGIIDDLDLDNTMPPDYVDRELLGILLGGDAGSRPE